MKSHPPRTSWSLAVALGVLLAAGGCHGGKRGGTLAADGTYQAARPAYQPEPKNPLFISGYAGGGLKPRPEGRSFRPTAEEASRPRRLRWGEIKDGLGL
jgi:hypothetical protein